MKKTITITINSKTFQMEESAYERLSSYLDDICSHLKGELDLEEIISDVETSISEKFEEKINLGSKVIILKDIEEIISIMGSPEVFGDSKEKDKENEDSTSDKIKTEKFKKLYRNPDDQIIAGVCSGIAAYFDWDPIIVRLVFAVSVFFGGAGVILYILLWIIVPEAKTNSQRIEMKGDTVTLAAIQEVVKKNINEIKDGKQTKKLKSTSMKILKFPFIILRAVMKVVKKICVVFFKIIRAFLGLIFFIVSIICIASIIFVALSLLFNINSPYIVTDIPLAVISSESHFRVGLIALSLAGIAPFIFLFQAGISLLRKKNYFSLIGTGILISISITGFIIAGVIGLEYIPRINEYVKNERVTTTEILPATAFKSVEVDGAYNVIITKGDTLLVEVTGEEKDLAKVKSEVLDEKLMVSEVAIEDSNLCLFCFHVSQPQIKITMPEIDSYKGSHANKSQISGFIGDKFELILKDASRSDLNGSYDNFNFDIKDASRFNFNGEAKEINLLLADASRATLIGKGNNLKAEVSDASRLSADLFLVPIAEIIVTDASRADLNVSKTLNATASDASKIQYTGEAVLTKRVIDVSASVVQVKNKE